MKEVIFKITNENYYRMLFVSKLSGVEPKDYLKEQLNHIDFNALSWIKSDKDYNEDFKKFKKEVRKRENK